MIRKHNTISFESIDRFFNKVQWGPYTPSKEMERDITTFNKFQTFGLSGEENSYSISPDGLIKLGKKQENFDGDLEVYCYVFSNSTNYCFKFELFFDCGRLRKVTCLEFNEIIINNERVQKEINHFKTTLKEEVKTLVSNKLKEKDEINKSKIKEVIEKKDAEISKLKDFQKLEFEKFKLTTKASIEKRNANHDSIWEAKYTDLSTNLKKEIKKNQIEFDQRLEAEKKHFEKRLQLQEKQSKVNNELKFEKWKSEQLIIYNQKLAEEFKKYAEITEI